MIKSIGTATDSPTISTTFLRNLLEDSRARGARLAVTVLVTAPVLVPKLAPFGSAYLPPSALREDRDEAMAFTLHALGGDASDLAVRGIWGDLTGLSGQIASSGPIVDLYVIGPPSTWDIGWLRRHVIESLLLGAGTPLVILPDARRLPAFRRIAFGWRPGGEAIRAAHDLVRLAEPGATIDVVTVGTPDESNANGEDTHRPLVEFLTGHGFVARSHWIAGPTTEADQLQAFALDASADLLAVGGFGHSRLREIVLGGVTRDLVAAPRLPLLLSH